MNRSKIAIINFCFLLSLTIGLTAQAQIDRNLWNNDEQINNSFWNGQEQVFADNIGLSAIDPVTVIINLINLAMGFIGIMTVIMIMMAGFKMLLSGGNEDAMGNAQKMLWGTFVGTFLMLSSFGIAKFFIGTIANATGI